jgi:uncharacterized protein (UPF0216 family)
MKVLIALALYDASEVRTKLATLTNKRIPYSRARIDRLIKEKLPTAQMIGNHYYITEKELMWLSEQIQTKKRPSNY